MFDEFEAEYEVREYLTDWLGWHRNTAYEWRF